MNTGEAILKTLEAENAVNSNGRTINITEAVAAIADAAYAVSTSIKPSVPGGTDATGGFVDSLTEATMGITAGLLRIADSISELAAAVRERPQ